MVREYHLFNGILKKVIAVSPYMAQKRRLTNNKYNFHKNDPPAFVVVKKGCVNVAVFPLRLSGLAAKSYRRCDSKLSR